MLIQDLVWLLGLGSLMIIQIWLDYLDYLMIIRIPSWLFGCSVIG